MKPKNFSGFDSSLSSTLSRLWDSAIDYRLQAILSAEFFYGIDLNSSWTESPRRRRGSTSSGSLVPHIEFDAWKLLHRRVPPRRFVAVVCAG